LKESAKSGTIKSILSVPETVKTIIQNKYYSTKENIIQQSQALKSSTLETVDVYSTNVNEKLNIARETLLS